MFNRLPPELVRQIIESSAASTYHYETYADRQATLCQFCLVCRLFREIAQSLLFEVVWIDGQSNLIALHRTLGKEGWRATIRQLIVGDDFSQRLDMEDFKRILPSCEGLTSLTLQLEYSGPSDLSMLQDLPHLTDLHLSGRDYHFPSGFILHALTSLSIDHTSIKVGPTLLDPVVLPSLRSLAMSRIYDDHEIVYLNRSRLDQLVAQIEVLFLDTRIIQRGLDYLIPACSRTLFDLYPSDSDDRITSLQGAQHLRIPIQSSLKDLIEEFVELIENQDRQISLRSVYLDISLKDLPSRRVSWFEAVQCLLRVCQEKGIEVIYEQQEVRYAGDQLVRTSREFRRRQREIRKLEATSE